MERILGLFYSLSRYSLDEFIEMWNICDEDKEYYDLQSRTHNDLEGYNRCTNDKVSSPHPNLLLFIQTIEIESCYQIQQLDDIRTGRVIQREHEDTFINAIPLYYVRFGLPEVV